MIYTTLKAVENKMHGLFESSRIRASITGHLYDALVVDENDTPIAVDNGVAVKIGDFTGNGLQEQKATVAGVKDKVAIVGNPALVKAAFTKAQGEAYNYFVPAGTLAKAYEVTAESRDIFGIADYQFTEGSAAEVKVGAYVVLDGKGAYVAQAAAPVDTDYGFIGRVHSISNGLFVNVVRIEVIKNEDVA